MMIISILNDHQIVKMKKEILNDSIDAFSQKREVKSETIQITFKLMLFAWIVWLFKPDWMISYYLPPLGFVNGLFKFYLLGMTALAIFDNNSNKNHGYFLFFIVSLILSTLTAEYWGLPKRVIKIVIQYYMVALITLCFCKTNKQYHILIRLFLMNFLYYNVWSILNGGIVPWHVRLNEQNTVGFYSNFGVYFAFYYSLGVKNRRMKLICYAVVLTGIASILFTFAQGAFLTMLVGIFHVIYRYPKKAKILLPISLLCLFITIAANFVPRETSYWEEMQKILNLEENATGSERLFYWELGLRCFVNNPILGVGPGNFGVAAEKYTTDSEVSKRSTRMRGKANLWGKQIHNSHLQVLTEMGIIGAFAYILLLIGFFKEIRFLRSMGEKLLKKKSILELFSRNDAYEVRMKYALSYGFEACMISYIVSGLFYNSLFNPWIWWFLILSRLSVKIVLSENYS